MKDFLEKTKKIFLALKNSHRYGNIIQLGYNCEAAYRFFRNYKFVDSSLFGWTFVPFENLKKALTEYDNLGNFGFEFDEPNHMFRCKHSGILFHGKTPASSYSQHEEENKAIIENDKIELASRIQYLKEKFLKTAKDGRTNLYIKKISKKEAENPNFREEIQWLLGYLKNLCTNDFKLLLVTEDEFYEKFLFDDPQILTRSVKEYSPDEDVSNKKLGDAFGWKLIYLEFRPKYKKKNSRKLKFEEIN